MSEENTIDIRIDPKELVLEMQFTLAKVRHFVAYGLTAAERVEYIPEDIPGETLPVRMACPYGDTVVVLRDEFSQWIVEQGIREAIESIQLCLEKARIYCAAVDLCGEGKPILQEQFQSGVYGFKKKFHRYGLPEKIEHLSKTYGQKTIPKSYSHIQTINLARNCLVHRNGIVGDRECGDSDELIITWARLEMYFQPNDGERVVIRPPQVLKDGIVQVSNEITEKRVPRGDRVSFSAREFAEICWTVHSFGNQLVKNVVEHSEGYHIPDDSNSPSGDDEPGS
jgi:hypothetical protein